MAFKGITNAYRKTDEYKEFMKYIKEDTPKLPMYLAEMAIAIHKTSPQLYKELQKKDCSKNSVPPPPPPTEFTDLVQIYTSEEFSEHKLNDIEKHPDPTIV